MIIIALYRPEKPANTGNIMRTCMAANAKLVIIFPVFAGFSGLYKAIIIIF